MFRTTVVMVALAVLGTAAQVEAQGRRVGQQDRRSRQEIARAQGVPPGHLPPANQCRVWYDNRPNGRQPSATSCTNAERIAARDRNARVIYGEGVYDDRYVYNNGGYGYPNGGAVSRIPGRNRDPRVNDPYYDRSRYTTPAFQNGYRDGLDKGREDAEDNDSFEPQRHSWYRSATRGYEDEYGSKVTYQTRYREAFQSGYEEGYRAFARR